MQSAATDTSAGQLIHWKTILDLGRYAPTPHNTQWYYIHPLDELTAQVGIDSTISLPHTDPKDQFRYVGLGVFVRHLELSAEATGYTLEASFKDDSPDFPVTVRITGKLTPNKQVAHLIKDRQTSRLAYSPEAISTEATQALTALSNLSHSLHMSSEENIVKSVLELNNAVLLNDLQDKGVGDELNNWIRYGKKSQATYQSGFTPATLAVPAWKVWLVFRFRKMMRSGLMKKWLTHQYFMQNRAGTVGWIYGPLATRPDQYQAGRFMMDAWMKVTSYGYYMQPYGSIITNDQARKRFLDKVGQNEEDGKMVWLAFRVGTSPKPAPSLHKSVQEYLR